jgi:hypothetical protein
MRIVKTCIFVTWVAVKMHACLKHVAQVLIVKQKDTMPFVFAMMGILETLQVHALNVSMTIFTLSYSVIY